MRRRLAAVQVALAFLLERTAIRLLLSLLILVSLLPLSWLDRHWWVLFALFVLELAVRAVSLGRSRRLTFGQGALLALDLMATLAFLPVHLLGPEFRLLRLVRLLRLFDYWSQFAGDLWLLSARPERRRQLAFVVLSIAFLCIASAVVLDHLGTGIDADGDGRPDAAEARFVDQMWWAFLQIESPDNLVRQPRLAVTFFLSLLLTVAGFFVFSFFIGIGASLVADLVEASRRHRIGFRDHVVILNPSPDSALLLSELCQYYRKQLRAPRLAVLGQSPEVPEYLLRREIGGTRYRSGSPSLPADLARVDVERAHRVLVLKHAREELSDAEVISTVLTVRELNPDAVIYAELRRAESGAAVRFAGGERAHPLFTRELIALFLANLVLAPRLRPVLEELLSSRGQEIYSCLYGERLLATTPPVERGRLPPFAELCAIAGERYGVQLLGTLTEQDGVGSAEPACFQAYPAEGRLGGLVGLTDRFASIRALAQDLARGRLDGDRAARRAAPASSRTWSPDRMPLSLPATSERLRVLLCGFREPALVMAEQLALAGSGVELTVLASDDVEAERAHQALATQAPRSFAAREIEFQAEGPGRYVARRVCDGAERGRVELKVGAWWLAAELARHVFEHDAAVLIADGEGADPDAATATALVNLGRLFSESPGRVRPDFRLVALIKDTLRSEVLERRFGKLPAAIQRPDLGLALLAGDRLRNEFLAQAAMVPGIAALLGSLFSQGGMQIGRLVSPAAIDQEVDFHALGRMLAGHGMVPLAVEWEAADGKVRVAINPRPGGEGFLVPRGRLRGVVVAGQLGS